MLAKYSGTCKVTGQRIVAGQTNIEKINGRWQVASPEYTGRHKAPEGAKIVIAWSDVYQDRYGDEYLKHFVAFGDDEAEPIGKWTKCSTDNVARAFASVLFEANKGQIVDVVEELMW